ncbi:hypothetical protein [Ideonella oryzae]|uniref:Uncharacterized protein n=1 Tax=Ideonella oryzae TaxID=2937441 RepID=A0ABT1BLM5_9BURK|nr:hypothetical protein [Ideonella oryzae]MCO5976804.1 hypothetical protein [Ideonella oryzae]
MPADSTAAVGEPTLSAMGRGKVPVALSAGEFKMPPEQVYAIGVQALDQIKNATHMPVAPAGFVPMASVIAEEVGEGEKGQPRYFFADGGLVDDGRSVRGFALGAPSVGPGDGLHAASNLGAQGAAPSAPSPTTSASIGVQTMPGRGTNPNDPRRLDAPVQDGATQVRGLPGVYRAGNSYGDSTQAAIDGAAPRGLPTPQSQAAATNLAARSSGAPAAALQTSQPAGPVGFSAPGGAVGIGSDWRRQKDLENAATAASSILNTRKWGGPGAENNPEVQAYQAALAQESARQRGAMSAQEAAMHESGATQREGMQQAGEDGRSLLQLQLAAAREQRAVQQQADQVAIERARLGIDATRAAGAGVPSGYRVKADGTGLEFIPGGPADPNTPKGRNNLTDTQAKALQFGTRMLESGKALDALAAAGVEQPGYLKLKRMADSVGAGVAANWTQTPQQQQVEQAQRDFVNAVLRRESGAAISESEFQNARRQYFPQPGDSSEVIVQKRRNRELATQGMLAEVPDHQNRVGQVVSAADQAASAAGGQQAQQQAPLQQRAVTRTGTHNGRKVVQYSDGSISYAD